VRQALRLEPFDPPNLNAGLFEDPRTLALDEVGWLLDALACGWEWGRWINGSVAGSEVALMMSPSSLDVQQMRRTTKTRRTWFEASRRAQSGWPLVRMLHGSSVV
jgi:hypothetical protein